MGMGTTAEYLERKDAPSTPPKKIPPSALSPIRPIHCRSPLIPLGFSTNFPLSFLGSRDEREWRYKILAFSPFYCTMPAGAGGWVEKIYKGGGGKPFP